MKHVIGDALVVLALVTLVSSSALAQSPTLSNDNIVRWARGTIDYLSLSSGEVTGSEEWHLTVHPDGSRTMHSINRMEAEQRQRHVTLRVAETFRPLEVTAVFWIEGQWRGTGLLAVNGNTLNAFVKTPDGMISQERHVPDHFSIIPHPLATNMWNTWYYDKAKGGAQKVTVYDMDSTAQPVSSMLGKLYDQTLEYVGATDMTVPAGTFDVEHFRYVDTTQGEVNFYVTGPDQTFVRFTWPWRDRDYVLTTYEAGLD